MSKPLSRKFLLEQGSCCSSDCTNCPYKEEISIREAVEAFWMDDPLLDAYYDQLGKKIIEQSEIKSGPYWDKIKELKLKE